jgi:CO/xanthine dehydrogenase Mo-binding subunit
VTSPTARQRYSRADGPAKLRGEARYTADMSLPGMLHAAFLYAGRAHARITRLDTTAARALPGVVTIITQSDVPNLRYGGTVRDRSLFADGIVRFEGEIVAAVAATTREQAKLAVAAIEVEYEDLEPVLDTEAALADSSTLVHAEWETYHAPSPDDLLRRGNNCGYVNIVKGDVSAGFETADRIIEERYEADKSHGAAIEPHAVLAQWEGPRVTIWSATQAPYLARGTVATALGLPEHRIRVVVPTLGGGFGSKCDGHFEPHVAALARTARRPVRLVFDRRETFVAVDMTRHPIITEVRTGLRNDGVIVARQVRMTLDTGAYATHGPSVAELATMVAAGPYRIPNLLVEAHTVYTNTTPSGSVRGPSGPQVCWAIESHMNSCADEAGMSPVDFRLENLVDEGDLGPTGQTMAAVGAKDCLAKASALIESGSESQPGEGTGVAIGWWGCYPSPSGAHVQLNAGGSATVITGAQENGSGAVMGLALLVEKEVGIPAEKVSFIYQDTDAAPFDLGSSASQTTYNNGRAVVAAARKVAKRLRELAAEEFEADASDIRLADGLALVAGDPGSAIPIESIVSKAMDSGELLIEGGAPPAAPMPPSDGATSCAGRVTIPAFQAPTFFAQAVRVAVDARTGVVRVIDAVAVHDFGHVINPRGAIGQVEGGVVHGIGVALLEGTQFGPDGLQRNPRLLEYKLQTAADVPRIRVEFANHPAADGGPYGNKGVGEAPVIPTAGAVANAIQDACGVRVYRLPMTPQRVWEATRRPSA